jgi:hypothetical protein
LSGRRFDGPVAATGSVHFDQKRGAVAQWRRNDDSVDAKLALVKAAHIYDRFFIPHNSDPALIVVAYEEDVLGSPFLIMRVDALSDCLDVWEDTSQRAWRIVEEFAALPSFAQVFTELQDSPEARSKRLVLELPATKMLYGA